MTEKNEFERKDIVVDRDMDVDCENATEITAYLETWFDVDKNSVQALKTMTTYG